MAEAITYADLRFVKAPLKKSVSSRLEQDPEDYEDGELTYENVQVPPVPAGAPSLASSGPADTARVKAKQPAKRCMKLSASQVLPCPTSTSCLQYLLLGLLLTCLLLGVATICLGVSYLQLSQQFQQVTRILAATNSSLRQQLRERITKLGQQEENLQEYRRQLSQSQEMLQEEQRVHQVAEQQLQACQLDREQTKETLKREEEQRQALDQRLNSMQNRLKSFSTCSTLALHPMSVLLPIHTAKSQAEDQLQTSALIELPAFMVFPHYFYLTETCNLWTCSSSHSASHFLPSLLPTHVGFWDPSLSPLCSCPTGALDW
ncbi:PREDICTED: B-cell differentiation antigen CD72 isoform X2 [Dipodomys ordii]|uniref:B-cell differentiation antigen CD72 isoform X2 n=1 Tax=Dipodomys ordii TaxID=10020 RepID=A0A1S3G222_DIPOR|nr:PREDICTED: B-cell differentiation antigen CD72 isoform X2 [Dipodomys ordii]